jgi:hypothetical protein
VSLADTQLLLTIIIANGALIELRVFMKSTLDIATDFGCKRPDKNPLFGNPRPGAALRVQRFLPLLVLYCWGSWRQPVYKSRSLR